MQPTRLTSPDYDTLRSADFTVPQAQFATTMLSHARLASPSFAVDGAEVWLATFLPPKWVCRLLANHVTSAAYGVEIYERAQRSPGLTLRLDLRADALGANCRDLIVDPTALRRRIDQLAQDAE